MRFSIIKRIQFLLLFYYASDRESSLVIEKFNLLKQYLQKYKTILKSMFYYQVQNKYITNIKTVKLTASVLEYLI